MSRSVGEVESEIAPDTKRRRTRASRGAGTLSSVAGSPCGSDLPAAGVFSKFYLADLPAVGVFSKFYLADLPAAGVFSKFYLADLPAAGVFSKFYLVGRLAG
jgi:hypothetical protein